MQQRYFCRPRRSSRRSSAVAPGRSSRVWMVLPGLNS